jgi:hypothetical protein
MTDSLGVGSSGVKDASARDACKAATLGSDGEGR